MGEWFAENGLLLGLAALDGLAYAALVFMVGSAGRGGATPVKLALAGRSRRGRGSRLYRGDIYLY